MITPGETHEYEQISGEKGAQTGMSESNPEKIMQSEIDEKNAEFWNELCGSSLARSLGITEVSLGEPASIR